MQCELVLTSANKRLRLSSVYAPSRLKKHKFSPSDEDASHDQSWCRTADPRTSWTRINSGTEQSNPDKKTGERWAEMTFEMPTSIFQTRSDQPRKRRRRKERRGRKKKEKRQSRRKKK